MEVQVKPLCYQWVNKGNVQGWGNAQGHLNFRGCFYLRNWGPSAPEAFQALRLFVPHIWDPVTRDELCHHSTVPLTPCDYQPYSVRGADSPQVSHFPSLCWYFYPLLISSKHCGPLWKMTVSPVEVTVSSSGRELKALRNSCNKRCAHPRVWHWAMGSISYTLGHGDWNLLPP